MRGSSNKRSLIFIADTFQDLSVLCTTYIIKQQAIQYTYYLLRFAKSVMEMIIQNSSGLVSGLYI